MQDLAEDKLRMKDLLRLGSSLRRRPDPLLCSLKGQHNYVYILRD